MFAGAELRELRRCALELSAHASGDRITLVNEDAIDAPLPTRPYRAVGCDVADTSDQIYSTAQMVLKVQRPARAESSGEAELDIEVGDANRHQRRRQ